MQDIKDKSKLHTWNNIRIPVFLFIFILISNVLCPPAPVWRKSLRKTNNNASLKLRYFHNYCSLDITQRWELHQWLWNVCNFPRVKVFKFDDETFLCIVHKFSSSHMLKWDWKVTFVPNRIFFLVKRCLITR